MSEQHSEAKKKIKQIMSFLRELHDLRSPATADLNSYEWSINYSKLPSHPDIQYATKSDLDSENDIVLRVKRPIETSCPPYPESLDGWVQSGWEKVSDEVQYLKIKNFKDENGATHTVKFEDDPERQKSFSLWSEKRRQWVEAEKPVRNASKVYGELHGLFAQLQRESEKYQIYLADGHLSFDSEHGSIRHPILIKRVELRHDSDVPEFTIHETDEDVEFYSALLRHHELDGLAINQCKERILANAPHPLSDSSASEFFRYFIQRFFVNGRFFDNPLECKGVTEPHVYRDPVLYLGLRSQGLGEALDNYIDKIDSLEDLSEALVRVVGIDLSKSILDEQGSSATDSVIENADSKIDFLLTKPTNEEQESIITRLEKTGTVLVQGPPGTGKSHTIANIVGHALASGQTVLVTSQTSKALKVVREKVVDKLRPLCVSVLDNDAESKAQLEESVNGIISYLSRTNIDKISSEIGQLKERRDRLKVNIKQLESHAMEIRRQEYTDIIVAGEGVSPSEAARKVNELIGECGWISGMVSEGAPLPISEEDLRELYGSNSKISIPEEKCIEEGLVKVEDIPTPSEFKEICEGILGISEEQASLYEDLWNNNVQDSGSLQELTKDLTQTVSVLSNQKWLSAVFDDCVSSAERAKLWTNLSTQIDEVSSNITSKLEVIYRFGPESKVSPTEEHLSTARELLNHVRQGKSINFLNLTFNSKWKDFLSSYSVDTGPLKTLEHFKAVEAFIEVSCLRRDLRKRWARQAGNVGAEQLPENEPEIKAKLLNQSLKYALSWRSLVWVQIESKLANLNFNLAEASRLARAMVNSNSHLDELVSLIEKVILPSLNARGWHLNLKLFRKRQESLLIELQKNSNKPSSLTLYINDMIDSGETLNSKFYSDCFQKLLIMHSKVAIYQKRQMHLDRISASALGWSDDIRERRGVHGNDQTPPRVHDAWKVKQWDQIIGKRLNNDYGKVQAEIGRSRKELLTVTAEYVEKLAWKYQFQRTGLKETQALNGWKKLQNSITKTGRGKFDPARRREAQKTLKECKGAVPVWIMPTSRVLESFDLATSRFDVLIIDEASQSDIGNLALFALAKRVIVVGDDKQVSPRAVGQKLDKVAPLIEEYLQGIPNRLQYELRTSLYDMAEQSFGGKIRLVEHFRCVPDIIEFSNYLSYSGEIKPLREASDGMFDDHVIPHRVEGALCDSKVNQREAEEIVSLVIAMTEVDEYRDAKIGIISLLGHEQVLLIESMIQKELAASVIEKHKILCGTAAQFQGDERNVILLSMVDTCDSPPLNLRQDENFQKSYNVAVSRAQDQLWVVHSLNPATDLKSNDLRLRLIQHAEDPKAFTTEVSKVLLRAESPFEEAVIKDLMTAGYRVFTQWEVGAYRIDLVVKGSKGRIAIECDGDRYHPQEKLADDMNRQLILERLGWSFIRIRGTEYFRNPEKAMKRVFLELERHQIDAIGISENTNSDLAPKSSPLKEKIIREATRIRAGWRDNNSVESGNEENSSLRNDEAHESTKKSSQVSNDIEHGGVDPEFAEIWQRYTKKGTPEIAKTFEELGFDVVDNRSDGGPLWVIDHPKLKKVMPHLKNEGYVFQFAANGGRATKARPAWYLRK